ncbi:MAG: sensor diguanylate cyclase [Holophagaceae bacterium]|nr:sensor diguanylate cyclase [Holophagaceae bacterium]
MVRTKIRAWGQAAVYTVLAAVVVSVAFYFHALNAVRGEVEGTFQHRSNVIRYYIGSMQQNVDSLERTFRHQYSLAPEVHFDKLRRHDELGVWSLSGLEIEDQEGGISGSATGLGNLPLSPPVRRELAAALALDPQIRSILGCYRDVSWIYYTSARRFRYLAPKILLSDFRFSERLYALPCWTAATPEHNPLGKQVISEAYEDAAGKGRMITISSPAVVNGQFLGVISMDLSVQRLKRLTGTGRGIPGETLLVDENGRILARSGESIADDRVAVPPTLQDFWMDSGGHEWLAREISADQLRLLHRIRPAELYLNAALRSAPVWFLCALLSGLLMVAWRLRRALKVVTLLMHHDPLTRALNRRGLFDRAPAMRAHTFRQGSCLAVALFDADFFKKVNDEQGHETGDLLLGALGRAFRAQMREYDALCRWGGEEFALVFEVEDPASIEAVAERLRVGAAEAQKAETGLAITLSGGVVLWRTRESLPEAINRADQLLYAAKHGGRDRLVWDSSEEDQQAARL